jgi:hypothetical protein
MARDSGFLPIKPSVVLITGRLDPAATLRLRAILGASSLGGIAARPAGTKSVPEPAESVSLLRIGPDHQMPPAADSSSLDIALLGPFLGCGNDSRQTGPFVLSCLVRHGLVRSGSASQWGLGRRPTPIPLIRRVAMLSSQSGGNPELDSPSGRTHRESGRRPNTVEMPVFG